jgi:predicted small metal-binding protein
MALVLRCNEVFEGCPGVVYGDTQEEVLRQAAAHAAEAHGLNDVDESTRQVLVAATRQE